MSELKEARSGVANENLQGKESASLSASVRTSRGEAEFLRWQKRSNHSFVCSGSETQTKLWVTPFPFRSGSQRYDRKVGRDKSEM